MDLIAAQPYITVHREINSIEQIAFEQERTINLFNDKIVTQQHEFHLQEVLDISYRKIGNEGGLLYLHTSAGLHSYIVKTSPQQFIESFKEYKNSNY
ncbi:hypothetical protein [Lederbergia citrea]|uniref:Uncharacterized protein n=1 Tax=Lederbergia citrea TaxID=2833581 RepID=A0A942UQI1_9BACI|nr:hypothetical protein [Lederbergia citrea]MBS4223712.1 hypothetical protein [Lederbergia citrea]